MLSVFCSHWYIGAFISAVYGSLSMIHVLWLFCVCIFITCADARLTACSMAGGAVVGMFDL